MRRGLLIGAFLLVGAACGGGSGTTPGNSGTDAGHDAGPLVDATSDDGGSANDAYGEPDVPTAPPVDATADVDNGAPSTSYPAPHPPLPKLLNAQGGPVLTAPRVHFVFYPGNAEQPTLESFASKLGMSTYWAAATSEYGVGPLSVADSTTLTGQTAPSNISSGDIQSWMATEIGNGAFGPPDPQAIYTIVYPSGTMIQQPNPVSALFGPVNSCSSFSGYHNSVTVGPDGGTQVPYAYAVIATCSSSVDDRTATISHEFVESSTDPQDTATGVFTLMPAPSSAFFAVDTDHVVWDVLGLGGEAADLCQPEGAAAYYTPTDVGNAVQRTWSNLLAAASHDPCAPDLVGEPFFNSAPVLDETVSFTSGLTGDITTKGVTIPVGRSRTIEVDLFSDAATGGPWTVKADDLLSTLFSAYGIAPTLSFQWDRPQGTNGEKLHLTITVTGSSILGGAHGFVITSTLGSRTYKWPGIVVE